MKYYDTVDCQHTPTLLLFIYSAIFAAITRYASRLPPARIYAEYGWPRRHDTIRAAATLLLYHLRHEPTRVAD